MLTSRVISSIFVQNRWNQFWQQQTPHGKRQSGNEEDHVFKIMKGRFNIMDLRIRYKGRFNPRPQFQAYMTKGAIKEFQAKCSG